MIKKFINTSFGRTRKFARNYIRKNLRLNLIKGNGIDPILSSIVRVVFSSDIKVYELESIALNYQGSKLFDTFQNKVYGKKSIEGNQRMAKVNLPSLKYYIISNVLVDPLSPIFIDLNKQKAIYQDYPLDNICLRDIDYATGHVWAQEDNLIAVNIDVKEEYEKGILFVGSYSSNWYHWAIEILSRIVLLDELDCEFADWPLIIPKQCYNSNNHFDLLKLLIKNRPVICLNNCTNLIKKAIYLDSPAIFPPKLWNDSKIERLKIGNFRTDVLKAYREKILNNSTFVSAKKNNNIFLSRKMNKRGYNQEEIILTLKKFDFRVVYLEELSVVEQIRTILNAKTIVGPIGAAWANILFSNADLAITWVPKFVGDQPAYSTMAEIANVDLFFLRFTTITENWVEFMKSEEEYYIAPEKITEIYTKYIYDK